MSYNKFPLNALVKQGVKFNDFESFSKFYSLDIYHGYYWHLTDNSNFRIDSSKGPRDMSSMGGGGVSENGAIMLTSDLSYWDEHYNTSRDSWKRDIKRPYVVLFDASNIDPNKLKQVGRGFGNEVYLDSNEANKLIQVGVYKLSYAKMLDKRFHMMIPGSKKDLYDLWVYSRGNQLNEDMNRRAYLNWKRKNVTLRGISGELGEYNGGGAMLGDGLYSAALSNRVMAREYGIVYFVLGGIPKHPKLFNTLNDWEIWRGNTLIYNWCKERGLEYDSNKFYAETNIRDEMLKLGYDGIIIRGREMVNYDVSDVKYFRSEWELEGYYERNLVD
jgi:hypothetical protein